LTADIELDGDVEVDSTHDIDLDRSTSDHVRQHRDDAGEQIETFRPDGCVDPESTCNVEGGGRGHVAVEVKGRVKAEVDVNRATPARAATGSTRSRRATPRR